MSRSDKKPPDTPVKSDLAEGAEITPNPVLGHDAVKAGEMLNGRSRLSFIIVGVIGFAAVITVVLNLGEIGKFAGLAAQAQPMWILAAVASQFGAFFCISLIWERILRRGGEHMPFLRFFPLSVAKLFADQALPSAGISGAAFILHALGRRGVPGDKAFTAFVFAATTFIAAFFTAALFSFISVALTEDSPPLLATGVTAFVFFSVFIALVMAPFSRFRRPELPRWLSRVRGVEKIVDLTALAAKRIAAEPIFFLRIVALQLVQRAIDGVTLWFVFMAIGQGVPYSICFIAINIAGVAATVAPTPMGIGTFEGGAVATLSVMGVPVEAALTATLLYRGLTLWLPLAPGFYILQHEMLRKIRVAPVQSGP